MRNIIFILALVISIPSFGQRRKKDDEPIISSAQTSYSLPQKGVRLHVTVIKEQFTPGPYANYAQQMLGINNVKRNSEINWLIKDISIDTFTEPNPDKTFVARGVGATLISLSPDGCLSGINNSAQVVQLENTINTNRYLSDLELHDDFSFDNITDTPFYMPGDSTNNFAPIRVGNEQKAKEAAKRVLDSRLAQYDIAAGMLDGLPPDGEAYKISIESLKKIEKEYLSLFAGRTTQSLHTFSFDYMPKSTNEEVVFRFSKNNGVVPSSDFSGKPVKAKIDVNRAQQDSTDAVALSNIFSILPVVGTINVTYELKTIASARSIFPQFGKIVPIDEELLDGSYSIEIYPTTGAIKSIRRE